MTQGLYGSVAPGWTGMSPGPVWPALGGAFGLEGAPPLAPSPFAFANAGLPVMTGTITTPFAVPGGVPTSTIIAAMSLRRGQPQGPASDQDVEELLYDTIELMPGAGEVEIRCEGGRVSLSGSVPNKRVKRDVGELAWAIPGINDVQNTLVIATRRRARTKNEEPRTKN